MTQEQIHVTPRKKIVVVSFLWFIFEVVFYSSWLYGILSVWYNGWGEFEAFWLGDERFGGGEALVKTWLKSRMSVDRWLTPMSQATWNAGGTPRVREEGPETAEGQAFFNLWLCWDDATSWTNSVIFTPILLGLWALGSNCVR